MRIFSKVEAVLDAQRGDLFPWAPVFFGLGIGIYFALRLEPGPAAWSFVAALALFCCTVAWRFVAARLWMAAILLILGGVSIAGCRAYSVAEPVLGFRYYGPIEGRI
ncbi:MAG: competence protein, partial [Paracoccaceae bacterium]